MSMEQAILEHASALRELGQAMKDAAIMNAEVAKLNGEMLLAQARQIVVADDVSLTDDQKAANKVEQKAQAETKKSVSAVVSSEQKQDPATATTEETIGTDDKVLDYKDDVTPVLLALHKKTGGLKDLLTKFGVAKGDQLKPEQFADIVAQANALLAA